MTSCHKRHRADHLIEDFVAKKKRQPVDGMGEIACPNCGTKGQFTEPQPFSGLVKTFLGAVDNEPACTSCARRPPRASS